MSEMSIVRCKSTYYKFKQGYGYRLGDAYSQATVINRSMGNIWIDRYVL